MLSVALCTYQGERYLTEQLASIAAQTRPPDELVVGDDGSTDATVAMLQRFAADASYPVMILARDPSGRLGAGGNFSRTLAACRGEVVALADQDDVWHPTKLAELERALAGAPTAQLAFSDADLIDEHGAPLGETLWHQLGLDLAERRRLEDDAVAVLLRHPVVTGCATAVRRGLLRLVLPVPQDAAMVHDQWLSLCAAACGPLLAVPEPLLGYRVHPAQQVGVTPRPRFVPGSGSLLGPRHLRSLVQDHGPRFEERSASLVDLGERFAALSAAGTDGDVTVSPRYARRAMTTLADYRRHLHARDALPPRRLQRIGPIRAELRAGAYRRFGAGISSAVVDLVAPPRHPAA